ncbi:MAG: hypothetical protein DMG06_28805, partial [Acidobacteria bacterium]
WLEQQGYDVVYASNLDLQLDPDTLKMAKVFLSVGDDEYWSRRMFEEALEARDQGLSFAFFSGNTLWHEIISYNSTVTGLPCRAFARKQYFDGEEAKLTGLRSGPSLPSPSTGFMKA